MSEGLYGEKWLISEEKYSQDKLRAKDLLHFSADFIRTMGAIAIVEFDSSPFYIEERRGESGRPFRCIKNRTIPEGMTEDEVPPIFSIIRKTGLDELIQVSHVLHGDMLLTGRPRPLVDSGNEATHHSVDMMRRYLPRMLFSRWLDVYDMGPPGVLSSFGNISKTLPPDNEVLCLKRAELDIWDAEQASPEHDRKILFGSLAYLDTFMKQDSQTEE